MGPNENLLGPVYNIQFLNILQSCALCILVRMKSFLISKILKKPSIVQKKMIPHMKAFGLFNKMKQKKKKI